MSFRVGDGPLLLSATGPSARPCALERVHCSFQTLEICQEILKVIAVEIVRWHVGSRLDRLRVNNPSAKMTAGVGKRACGQRVPACQVRQIWSVRCGRGCALNR